MTREEKEIIIRELTERFATTNYFYITDASTMSVASINQFRRLCFDRGIDYKVYKNSLIKKALETIDADTSALNGVLKGASGILFSAEAGNAPAKLIKEFRKRGNQLPLLKGAYIDAGIYIGDNQLDTLTNIKSKNELIGDIIGLLQSPAKNVVSALQSSGGKLAGILKTLSEKE
ncbi:50S ribosomal protein L10 [Pontibacter sp. SGAir0037]|uniref:50S ribosomal protein L10 n=1 Tax=Pontibacter sp. SGAir0037 TaxID=2571030 RepID=UPI0010CCF7CD|nr:50S ribosomal protein L10 [Pontibacter sp. SGAir0037]QCR23471.1 50S ribosomal protein L10 [Pontibacter sp. SGAir0037]